MIHIHWKHEDLGVVGGWHWQRCRCRAERIVPEAFVRTLSPVDWPQQPDRKWRRASVLLQMPSRADINEARGLSRGYPDL
jgi:hypothetical protein